MGTLLTWFKAHILELNSLIGECSCSLKREELQAELAAAEVAFKEARRLTMIEVCLKEDFGSEEEEEEEE